MKKYNLALVGVSNPLGKRVLKVLEERNFPVNVLRPLVTRHLGERSVTFNKADYVVDVLSKSSLKGMDIVFFTNEEEASQELSSLAVEQGMKVIDNSPQCCLQEDVPLIVPEVNPEMLGSHKKLVASPHPLVTLLSLVLKPIYNRVGLKRIVVSYYQPASEKGEEAEKELRLQVKDFLGGERPKEDIRRRFLAFNLIPFGGNSDQEGNSQEEAIITQEIKKVIRDPSLIISLTVIQVPLFSGSSASVNIETKKEIKASQARSILSSAPGVELIDKIEELKYPVPLETEGKEDVLVGRIRQSEKTNNCLDLWIAGDNLYKGSALNMVQIAEMMIA